MKSPPVTTLKLFNGNKELALKYVEKCKQEIPKQLNKLIAAAESRATDEISDIAHSFKGQLAYLGANHLVEMAKILETKSQNPEWASTEQHLKHFISGITQLMNEL